MNKKNISKAENFDIEANITSCDMSHRGGTIKVDVSELFGDSIGGCPAIMGAYQNYLGGGMRGSIVGAAMFDPADLSKDNQEIFFTLKERIKKYAHAITNDEELDMNDEWNTMEYEKQQSLPVSAF